MLVAQNVTMARLQLLVEVVPNIHEFHYLCHASLRQKW